MKIKFFLSIFIISIASSFTMKEAAINDEFKFKVEWAKLNKTLWSQPYRYENTDLKSLTVKFVIERIGTTKELNINYLSLVDETKKVRIRPNAIYYLKGNDKKIYLKSKAVNKNYNAFEEHNQEGFKNIQAKTFKPNILGRVKKGKVPTIKSLKKLTIKDKITYYIDFPVNENFSYGKIYFKDEPIGFAAIKLK